VETVLVQVLALDRVSKAKAVDLVQALVQTAVMKVKELLDQKIAQAVQVKFKTLRAELEV
jgi:hypothetical protein